MNYDQHADVLGDLEGVDLRCFDLKAADFFFSPSEPFSTLWERLPADWQPDVVVWWSLEYAPVPEGLEACPCLLVAALGDWNLNFATTLPLFSAFDWIFTDRLGTAKLSEAGYRNVSYWPNFAFCPSKYRSSTAQERPWDVTYIGSFNFAVQQERAPWLKRLARLSDHYRVYLGTWIYGDAYVRLLSQSKIVFNRSIRREMNMRAYEAPAAGALLFMEEENLEIREYLTPGIHCVLYNDQNLETLLDYYLTHDEERRRIARAGHEKIRTESYRHHLLRLVHELEQLPLASTRPFVHKRTPVEARLRAIHNGTLLYPGVKPIAEKDFHVALRNAPDDHEALNALGVLIAAHWKGLEGAERELRLQEARRFVEQAVTLRPHEATYRYNLGQLLCLLGEERRAQGELLKSVVFVERDPVETNIGGLPLFDDYDPFFVEWQRATFTHIQHPEGRRRATAALLQWRAWEQLGDIWERAGRLLEACQAFTEALRGREDMGHTRSRLAALLARLGEHDRALQEYRQAIRDAPFLVAAWAELATLLANTGRRKECCELLRECLAVIDACPVYEPLRTAFADLRETVQTQRPSIEADQTGPAEVNDPQAPQTSEVHPMPRPSPHGDLQMSRSARPRVLLIQLEFATWAKARSWGYIANFGIEEGLRANGIDCFTIPAIHGLPPASPRSWLSHARELCAGKQFDQVWTWLIHVEYEQSFLEWIATLAPVRVGLLMESLRYDPAAYMFAPHLRARPAVVEQQIRHMTHVLAGDERDAYEINSRGLAKALWWLNAVPERFISERVGPAPNDAAVFYGALYGERQGWLEHPELKELLIRPPHAPEDTTEHPRTFDALNSALISRLQQGLPTDEDALGDYVRSLRSLRQAVFARWLEGFRDWSAVVNLPTFAKFYAGRVVEAMAAGRPVISWEVPDRPRNTALFEHGKEILLYPKNNLSVLAGHIQHTLQDRDFAEELTANARHNLMRFHTAEKRAQQILEWIQAGIEPTFHQAAGTEQPVSNVDAMTAPATPARVDPATHESEDEFYVNLFVKTPHWSTPYPNPDESARWAKIRGFLEQVIHPGQNDGAQRRLRLLDLGCGRGWLTNLASAYGEAEGVEPVARVIEHARQHFPHLRFYVGTAETVLNRPDFQPYDVVLTSEVIEHVPRDQQAGFVETLRRLLKPHGHLFLTTPRGEVLEQWKQIAPPNQPIEDWLTEHDLGHLLTSRGFRCIGCERIYIQIPSLQFMPAPAPEAPHSPNLMPIYQVWACERLGDPVPVRPSTRRLGPMVSVIVPTYNRPDTLTEALQSILNQSYQDFEIITVNDCGMDVEPVITSLNHGGRITYVKHDRNRGLGAARNTGIRVARGKYIAYLDDDDRYLPNHLETLVTFLEQHDCQVAYTDAWRLHQVREGDRYVATTKDLPYSFDFDPVALLALNYFPVLCVMHEKAGLDQAGLFDETLCTLEDWDLWIRLASKSRFAHVKRTTAEFSWRTDGTSMTSSLTPQFLRSATIIYRKYWEYAKEIPGMLEAQRSALQLKRQNITAPLFDCSIIIPIRNGREGTQRCLTALTQAARGIDYEVIVVDDTGTDDTEGALATLSGDVQIIRNSEHLGFARACNQAVGEAKGRYLVFLSNETIPLDGWLEALVDEVEIHPEVAVVGSKLVSPEGTIRHAGVVFGADLLPYHIHSGLDGDHPAVNHRREFQAVTAACFLVRRDAFEAVGGFDEEYRDGLEDVDLCLKVRQRGYQVVYAPESCLERDDKGEGSPNGKDSQNAQALYRKWQGHLHQDDVESYTADGFAVEHTPPSPELAPKPLDRRDLPGSSLKDSLPLESAAEEDRLSKIDIRARQERPRIALIYDNTIRPDTTGEYCERALQQIAEVVHFLPRQLREIPADGFDLYLRIDDSFRYGFPPYLRPSAFWAIDTHIHYQLALDDAKRFDFVFCAQKDGAEQFQRDGIQRVWWLPAACDPEIHKPYPADKAYDVAFVGHTLPGPRTELLNLIQAHFPHSFIGEAYFEEMAKVYSRARIVFNRSLKNDMNMRVFETLATGSFLLTNDLSDNGQSELFQDKVHLVTYRSPGELLARILYYRDREQERELIAARGREEVLTKHTYLHRMRRVLETCCGGEDRDNGVSGGTPRSQSREAREGLPSLTAPPKASIVILAWNQLDYSRACVESVIRHTKVPYELILVDNGSSDATLEYFRSVPGAKVVANGENLGFAAGNNRGIRAATGDSVVLLNNDAIVTEGWLRRMITCAESDPAIGIVGPTSNYVSGYQLDQEARYQTLEEMEAYAGRVAQQRNGQWIQVQRLVGFCMLIKRSVVQRIGVLDERFGVGNFEDDDYCLRARQVGFKLIMAQDVFIHHFGARTFVGNHVDYSQAMERGWAHFLDKWGEQAPDAYRAHAPLPSSAVDQTIRSAEEGRDDDPAAAVDSAVAGPQPEPEREVQPLLRQGLELLQSGRITEAATLFLQAARLEPTDVDVLTGVAHCALAMGEAGLARQFLKHILALDPEHEGARASLSALEGEANADQVRVP